MKILPYESRITSNLVKLFSLLLYSSLSFAQVTESRISEIQVFDSITKEPLENATIVIYSKPNEQA